MKKNQHFWWGRGAVRWRRRIFPSYDTRKYNFLNTSAASCSYYMLWNTKNAFDDKLIYRYQSSLCNIMRANTHLSILPRQTDRLQHKESKPSIPAIDGIMKNQAWAIFLFLYLAYIISSQKHFKTSLDS